MKDYEPEWGDEADVPRIVEMGQRFAQTPEYEGRAAVNDERIAWLTRQMLNAHHTAIFVGGAEDGPLAGMLAMHLYEHPFSGERVAAELVWWVEPEQRGIGVRLLRRAEQWAREHDAAVLEMGAPSERVARFYEAVGFHATDRMYQRRLT